jgi:hypothetical protein
VRAGSSSSSSSSSMGKREARLIQLQMLRVRVMTCNLHSHPLLQLLLWQRLPMRRKQANDIFKL